MVTKTYSLFFRAAAESRLAKIFNGDFKIAVAEKTKRTFLDRCCFVIPAEVSAHVSFQGKDVCFSCHAMD